MHRSEGRAFPSHGRGRRFNPYSAHQPSLASRATARQAIYRPSTVKRAKAAASKPEGRRRAKSRAIRTITPTWQLLSRLTATTRRVRRAGIRNEALREERQDLVACLDGRLAGRVEILAFFTQRLVPD